MKTEFGRKLLLLILDKLILAGIVGVAVLLPSWMVDEKLERVKSDLAIQRIIAEREINVHGMLWSTVFDYGQAFQDSFHRGFFNDLGKEQEKVNKFLHTHGAFIGIDKIQDIKNRLFLNEDRARELNQYIEMHKSGNPEGATSMRDFLD